MRFVLGCWGGGGIRGRWKREGGGKLGDGEMDMDGMLGRSVGDVT